MNEMLKIILSLSLSGFLLMLILFLLRPLFKERLSKRWQYYIWLLVITRLLLPYALETNLVGTIFQFIDKGIEQAEFVPNPDHDLATAPYFNTSQGNYAQKGQDIISDEQTEHTSSDNTTRDLAVSISQNLWLIWLVVALILLVRKITAYQSFVRYIRAGCVEVADIDLLEQFGKLVEQKKISNTVELYKNSLISSPMLIGFFHPCIVIPTTHLTTSDFKYTIQHELTHCKQLDMFYKWLMQLTVCVHWFNPFVYLMSRQVDRACELSCDEAVIRVLDIQGRKAYGDTLLNAIDTEGKYKPSLASITLIESKERIKERLDAIMKYKKQSKFTLTLALVLTISICLGSTMIGAYATPKQTNPSKVEVMETDSFISIPVHIKSIADSEYVWLGEYTLSAGDKIRYEIFTISGEHIAVGFTRSTRLTPTYFTSINNRTDGLLTVSDGFDVSDNFAGKYNLFIQACLGDLENISGTIQIGKIVDDKSKVNQNKNAITVPVDIASAKNGEFIYLGKYTFSHGDKIHFNVSAATGNGLEVGLVSPNDDPLNRTYYTSSAKRYNGVLEINSDSIFSVPVKAGQYKLFVHATDDLTSIKGNVTITKQTLNLETITLKDKTYYMITTKEQLLALAAGQLDFDKNYMLQKDIDLSDVEWTPIGTAEKPFTGSFNGNGCEIKGLTMKDPDVKIIGMFGYADGANIYNITLRDYDIETAGRNIKDKDVSPILVFGTDTRSYSNFVYPKK